MKKLLLLLSCLCALALSLSACANEPCETCTFGDWSVTQPASCAAAGKQVRACTVCGQQESAPIEALPHTFGDWVITKTSTCTAEGQRMHSCQICGAEETEPIAVLPIAYTLTADSGFNVQKFLIPASGSYFLPTPEQEGHIFMGWVNEAGEEIPNVGHINKDTTVTALWETVETDNFADFKRRIEKGAKEILLTADIVLTETVYVVADTTITLTADHTLLRSPEHLDDLFVLGENADGSNALLQGKRAVLTLRPQNGATLTIDGNKGNMANAAQGSAFFLVNSSSLNIHDGVCITGHKKGGNLRLDQNARNISNANRVGGSAVVIANGACNMYGGIIADCEVSTTDSTDACLGGAIYNYGTFTMHGGTISDCTAARGAALYNYRVAFLYSGMICDNHATVYGGMMYQTDSQYTYSTLGCEGTDITLHIVGNTSEKSGGAIFASHQSTVAVLGGTRFAQNSTSGGNGGAINMAGELMIRYAIFEGNTASSKGGAIYGYYGKTGYSTRIIRIDAGLFTQNEAPRGGAIALGKGDEVDTGARLILNAVEFSANNAPKTSADKYGYGGAIHVDTASSVSISGASSFLSNTAADKGGAIYITKTSSLTVQSSGSAALFRGNSAVSGGGCIYNSGSAVVLKGRADAPVLLEENSVSAGTGGALAVYSEGTLELSGVTLYQNTASDNGGAIYISDSTVVLQGNASAPVLLEQNSSSDGNGGAVAVHSSGMLKLFGAILRQNTAAQGNGGAVYVYGAHAIMGDSTHTNGGSFEKNSAKKGGAIFISSTKTVSADVTAHTLTANENTSSGGGGAIYIEVHKDATDATVSLGIVDLTATANHAEGNGGALYIYTKATVSIGTLTATGNSSAEYGGAAYVSGAATATVNCVTAHQNGATAGGFLYLTTTATTVTLNSGDITGNTADKGSAIYSNSKKAVLNIKGGDSQEFLVFDADSITGKDGFAITPIGEEDAQ